MVILYTKEDNNGGGGKARRDRTERGEQKRGDWTRAKVRFGLQLVYLLAVTKESYGEMGHMVRDMRGSCMPSISWKTR